MIFSKSILFQIGGRKIDGIGFLAARQYLDAARPVVQLLVKRVNRAAESKYSMGGSLEQSFSFSEDLPEEKIDSSPENTDEEQDVEDLEEPKVCFHNSVIVTSNSNSRFKVG